MRTLHSSIAASAIVQLQHSLKYSDNNEAKGMSMASYAHSVTHGTVEQLLTRAARFLDGTADRYARYCVYRTTLDELRSLSDRDLADLGMHRAGLKAIAAEAAERYSAS